MSSFLKSDEYSNLIDKHIFVRKNEKRSWHRQKPEKSYVRQRLRLCEVKPC